jgi:hypothetical protein
MMQQTPEQWWRGMTSGDQTELMDEVDPDSRVSLELWLKLRRAGVIPVGSGFGDHGWEYYLPTSYLRYVLARAAERAA